MKTAMFYGGRDIRVEEIPDPEPGLGEVLIRIRSAGVCGSDLHNYRGNRPAAGDVPWRQGHELAGEVAGFGQGVTGLELGQRVGIEAEHLVGCGTCRECRAGRYHICPTRGMKDGVRHGSYGFSELDVCIAENVKPIPDHVSMDAAALLDCYAVDVHAVHQAPVTPDDTVVILGAGAIALTLGQVSKAFGAARVIMIGTRRQPLDVALSANAADETVVGEDRSQCPEHPELQIHVLRCPGHQTQAVGRKGAGPIVHLTAIHQLATDLAIHDQIEKVAIHRFG